MSSSVLLSSYFDREADPPPDLPYFTLGARRPEVGVASLDSSDQLVIALDGVTGIGACRSGISMMDPQQEIVRRSIGEILYVGAHPTGPTEVQLRSKLALEQSMRVVTGRRPYYFSIRARPPMLPPRLMAAGMRVVEDYRRVQTFANSVYAVPGMLLMADGRLNAQNFPGPAAVDLQARLLRARGVRYVALAKDGMLVSAARQEARSIRRRVGTSPFAFPILRRHLELAYRASGQSSASPKTIRHGNSSSALGGVGAIRFALSLSADHLTIVEMSLYDFDAFSGLVRTGESLESFVYRIRRLDTSGNGKLPAIYSWDLVPLVQSCDWERHIIPTLEEIVFSAYTDTELGIYPRALADVHYHVKLRFADPELETRRRQIVVDLARMGVPVEEITIVAEGPHKLDPDEFDAHQP